MTRNNAQKLARILTNTFSGFFALGLAAATAAPALAQAHGKFTFTGSINTARAFHTATLLNNGQVLVAGGLSIQSVKPHSRTTILSSAELYNPATGQWTVTGSMPTPRYLHTATLLNDGEVLITGGQNDSGILSSAELYNPSRGTWSTTGSMTVAREQYGAALLQDGEVLVAGGNTPKHGPIAAAELYDPTTGTWTATGSMNYARGTSQLTLLQNGEALIAGGNEGFTGTIAENTGCTAELFSNGHWRLTDLAFCGVTGDTAALLPNRDVVVDVGSPSQFYDPFTNVWHATLGQSFAGPLASLANAKVLVVAGSNAELYDPSTNEWTPTGSLRQALLDGHTLTRLLNGQVLAAGGEIEIRTGTRTIIITTARAELYTP